MFKPGTTLTNSRPPKTSETEVILTPTSGNIKLNQPAAIALKIADEDYAGINVGEEVDENGQETGNKVISIFKGTAPVEEGGKVIKKAKGGKVSISGGNIQFSSINAWQQMGGNTNERIIYHVDMDTKAEADGIYYFILVKDRVEPKATRKAKVTA